jgi:hypothetical protein
MSDGISIWIGPFATVFAATVAAGVAFTFGSIQASIAKSQRNIAYEKVKIDLFDKRYKLFQSCKEILEVVIGPDPELTPYRHLQGVSLLQDAIFLCPDNVVEVIRSVVDLSRRYNDFIDRNFKNAENLHNISAQDIETKIKAFYDEGVDLYGKVNTVFPREFGFNQLRGELQDENPLEWWIKLGAWLKRRFAMLLPGYYR